MGMMINRRRVMGGGEKLPQGAVRIEYLESKNGAYIDPLIKRNINYVVDCKFRLVNTSNKIITPFGFYTNTVAIRIYYNHNTKTFMFQYKAGNTNTGITVTNDWYEVLFGNDRVEINSIIFNAVPYNDYIDNYHFLCFASSAASGYAEFYSDNVTFVDIAHISISLNNIVLRDLIPVRIGNVGYMYDKVSGQLFGNNGTGSFILGPDK